MQVSCQPIKHQHLIKHPNKRRILIKFLLVLFILVSYLIFLSLKFGLQQGFLATILTWSFFVLCTPIADAGFILDFPIRLITHIKMLISETFVWIVAILINLWTVIFHPQIYTHTRLLQLFFSILTHPYPFYGIILLSLAGTFLSIIFGDELLDTINHKNPPFYKKHKNKYRLIIFIFIFTGSLILYYHTLHSLNINI